MRDFAAGILVGVLVIFSAALAVLCHYVSRDTESFRQFLEGI